MKFQKIKDLPWIFFVITFLFSWTIWIPFAILGISGKFVNNNLLNLIAKLSVIIAAFGPGLGALYSIKRNKGYAGLKEYIKSIISFDIGLKAWVIPLLFFFSYAFIFSGIFFSQSLGKFSLVNTICIIIGMTLIGGGQEEIGWRGYIINNLEDRYGILAGNTILAIVWTVWHLPLFFIPAVSQYHMSFFAFMLYVFGLTGILAWTKEVSGGKILACMLVHGLANASLAVFPVFSANNGSNKVYYLYVIPVFFTGVLFIYLKKRIKNKAQSV